MALRRSAARVMGQALAATRSEPVAVQAAAHETAGIMHPQGVRFASLLDVKNRMKAVNNIRKITSAMKMVAASKMRRAEQACRASRGFSDPILKLLGEQPAASAARHLTVAVSTDKGLCGGINGNITKAARATHESIAEMDPEAVNALVVLGEKCKTQLNARGLSDQFAVTVSEYTKTSVSFDQSCFIADQVLAAEGDVVRVLYNRFKSAMSFEPTVATVLVNNALDTNAALKDALDKYEMEDGCDFQSLAEFQLASTLHTSILENTCCEHASRMSAMESSTKNAGDMLASLTLQYNRTRQAAITTELIEILAGAAALEG